MYDVDKVTKNIMFFVFLELPTSSGNTKFGCLSSTLPTTIPVNVLLKNIIFVCLILFIQTNAK